MLWATRPIVNPSQTPPYPPPTCLYPDFYTTLYYIRDYVEKALITYILEVTACNLEVTAYILEVTDCNLEVTDYNLDVTACKLEVSACKLEVTTYILKLTAYILSAERRCPRNYLLSYLPLLPQG